MKSDSGKLATSVWIVGHSERGRRALPPVSDRVSAGKRQTLRRAAITLRVESLRQSWRMNSTWCTIPLSRRPPRARELAGGASPDGRGERYAGRAPVIRPQWRKDRCPTCKSRCKGDLGERSEQPWKCTLQGLLRLIRSRICWQEKFGIAQLIWLGSKTPLLHEQR